MHASARAPSVSRAVAVPIGSVPAGPDPAYPTGLVEVDRVLGGGLVPGSVTLVGGEPGVGKSTLLLQMVASTARSGARALYVTGEESAAQVRDRAHRLNALADELYLLADTEVETVVDQVTQIGPRVVVVDSVQAMRTAQQSSAPGSVGQVRDSAARLVELAKATGVAVVLVGHVTKDGALAGPRQLEHLVDTVLSFEGDRHESLRLLRAVKHRYGSTAEIGLFDMVRGGLEPVADASSRSLQGRLPGQSGSVVFAGLEGRRPLLVEVQALAVRSKSPVPRRSARGLDSGRLGLLLAVLEERAGVSLLHHDVHALAVGGVRLMEPAADLALALAVASAAVGHAISPDVVAMGEIGLGGEVRAVPGYERRLAEAARLGFRRAIVPASCAVDPAARSQLQLVGVTTLPEALVRTGCLDEVSAARRRKLG